MQELVREGVENFEGLRVRGKESECDPFHYVFFPPCYFCSHFFIPSPEMYVPFVEEKNRDWL